MRFDEKKILLSALLLQGCVYLTFDIDVHPEKLPNGKVGEPYYAKVGLDYDGALLCDLHITEQSGLTIRPLKRYLNDNTGWCHREGVVIEGIPTKPGKINIGIYASTPGLGGPGTLFIPKYELLFNTDIEIKE